MVYRDYFCTFWCSPCLETMSCNTRGPPGHRGCRGRCLRSVSLEASHEGLRLPVIHGLDAHLRVTTMEAGCYRSFFGFFWGHTMVHYHWLWLMIFHYDGLWISLSLSPSPSGRVQLRVSEKTTAPPGDMMIVIYSYCSKYGICFIIWLYDTVDGCEVLRQLVTNCNHQTL